MGSTGARSIDVPVLGRPSPMKQIPCQFYPVQQVTHRTAAHPRAPSRMSGGRYTTDMADITLRAQPRTILGKKVAALRRAGIIPANIYGRGIESLAIQMDVRDLRDALAHAGTSTVIEVQVAGGAHGDGQGHPALIEHVSTHPASGKVLHVDLRKLDLTRPIRAAVPLVMVGEAPAANAGAVIFSPLDEIDVEALPNQLPHQIEVDVSALHEIDNQITVADLRLPDGVEAITDPETLVVRAMASKLEQEVLAEAAEAAAETAEAEEAAVEEATEEARAAGAEAPVAEAGGAEQAEGETQT